MPKNNFVRLLLSASAISCPTGANAQDIVPPKQYTVTPGGVGLADGSFTFSDTDLSIGGLSLERFHLGGPRDPNDPFFGPRMSHNFDIYIAPNHRTTCTPGCDTVNKPVVHMGLSASGTFYETLPPYVIIWHWNDDSYSGDLERDSSGAYVYTDQAGTIFTFSTTVPASGSPNAKRVSNIVFAGGRRQDFLYNGSNQLKAVTDTSGYAIVFDYGSNGNVATACGYNLAVTYVSTASTCAGAALKASYGYTDSKLTSVTDVSGGVTTYSYDRNEIACVKQPGYASCKIANVYGSPSYAWQVTQQTLADGTVWRFQYTGNYLKARDPEAYAEVEPSTTVIVTDPASKVSQYAFVQSSPYSASDPYGKTTGYKFSGGSDYSTEPGWSTRFGSMLTEVTLPELNSYGATYGLRNAVSSQTLHAKPGPGSAPDLTTTYGYVANCEPPNSRQSCAKPIWKRNPKGLQTDYTYANHGGILSEMQPAPSAGAARPLKLFTYVQRYAYIKNAGGSLVAAASPIWLPDTETQCQTTADSSVATCDSAAPITVTTFQYGANGTANNLLLRGKVVSSGGVSLRTCYGYDNSGNKIFETAPRAGLGVCS